MGKTAQRPFLAKGFLSKVVDRKIPKKRGLFLWFVSFGQAKEMNSKMLIKSKDQNSASF